MAVEIEDKAHISALENYPPRHSVACWWYAATKTLSHGDDGCYPLAMDGIDKTIQHCRGNYHPSAKPLVEQHSASSLKRSMALSAQHPDLA
ncbi:MAG: hypothetical protein AAES65_10240 [Candidatus Thiodiazotropha sp. (ex. Lucinoma kazani)]